MNFEESENQGMIADMVRELGKKEIEPYKMQWDESQEFPIDLFKKLGELGLMGVLVPHEYGGSGFGYLEYVTAISELAKIDGSIGLSMAAHNSLCTGHILEFASDTQKRKWLPKLASGEWIGAWGLTESNTGSDAGNMKTTARLEGDHWIINGSKNFITHGISGDIAVVIARTGEPGDSHGMTAFAIEKRNPWIQRRKKRRQTRHESLRNSGTYIRPLQSLSGKRIGRSGRRVYPIIKGIGWRKDFHCSIKPGYCTGFTRRGIKIFKGKRTIQSAHL